MRNILIRIVNIPAVLFVGFFHGIYYCRKYYECDLAYKVPFWKWHWKDFLKNCITGKGI